MKKSEFSADLHAPNSPKFRAVKIYAIDSFPENSFIRSGNRRELGRGGDGEGCSPAPNSLLVAALGQIIANNVWIFVPIVSINTGYKYSLNKIYS